MTIGNPTEPIFVDLRQDVSTLNNVVEAAVGQSERPVYEIVPIENALNDSALLAYFHANETPSTTLTEEQSTSTLATSAIAEEQPASTLTDEHSEKKSKKSKGTNASGKK